MHVTNHYTIRYHLQSPKDMASISTSPLYLLTDRHSNFLWPMRLYSMRMQSSRSTFRKCVVSRRSLQGSAKSTGNMTSARRWSSSSVWCFEHRHRMEGLWTFLAATFHPWSIMFYYAFLFFILLFFLLRPRVHFNSYWLNKFDFDFNLFYFNLFHL